MNSKLLWNDQIPEKDGVRPAINDIAVSPDGSKLVVAVGNRVLLYRSENGDLVESLRGHKDTVYSVSFSSDGSRFASGGADHIVVIWKSSGQGLLKYNHTAPIQRVLYNPTMLLLASCSDVDFGLWTPDQKQVTKEKVSSRISAAAWSTDGSLLAVGMISGLISIRNQQAEELLKFERKAPIWCMAFIPDFYPSKGSQSGGSQTSGTGSGTNVLDSSDLLAIGCWDKTYSLYRISSSSHKLQTEKQLNYFPCSMSYSVNQATKSTYLIISGSNNKVTLYSREGVKLTEVYQKDSWVWSCYCHGDSNSVALGSNNGSIDFIQLKFNNVHTLFRDRYSYRENLTEVIVHHLVTDKKVRIKCKDLIQNLSLYRNKLAVQLSDRVSVYESNLDDSTDMHFRLRKEKILINTVALGDVKALPSSKESTETWAKDILMAITTSHLLFCRGNVMELFSFEGQRQRLWTLEAKVNCIRVDGGPEGREGVFVGLASGAVQKVFVDNLFPLEVMRRPNTGIIQLDINLYRTTLACVDSSKLLCVVDIATQETLHSIPGVTSATFNTEVEDLICVTGADTSISVVSGIRNSSQRISAGGSVDAGKRSVVALPEIQEQHIFGLGLGFRGQRIFCIYKGGVVGVDVPQGLNMQRALDLNDIDTAYKIACLGATEADWKLLAMRSLRANYLSIAKNAFSRLKDVKFLTLIDTIERRGGNAVLKSSTASSGSDNRSGGSTAAASSLSVLRNHHHGSSNSETAPTALSIPPLESTWLAELMAYEGHHHEAAKIYARSGRLEEAIRLFTDLRRWEDAKMFARNAGQADISGLTLQQAKWLQEINDWKGASDLFLSMGQHMQAAKIIAETQGVGWQDALIEVVRACPSDSLDTLNFCGEKFGNSGADTSHARETYIKAKDISKLMTLYARRQMWKEAAVLADEHDGKFDVSIFLSYAEWLVSQDRYEEAMLAFKKSKRADLARKVLEELTGNAVAECRFKDAAYYYWMLSRETEGFELSAPAVAGEPAVNLDGKNDGELGKQGRDSQLQHEYEHKADLYYAYANIHSFVTDPFTSQQPEMLFQVSRFIINSLGSSELVPHGISKAATLYTLARQSMILSAFKLARHSYDRLSKLQIPDRKAEEVEIDMLLVQAKPVRDDPDQLPVCYRCSSTNPLLNPFTNKFAKGDVCTNCGHPFVRSFLNFDILPLVEFVPEPSITDEEAIEYIRQPPPLKSRSVPGKSESKISRNENTTVYGKKKGWKESKGAGGEERLTLSEEENGEEDELVGRRDDSNEDFDYGYGANTDLLDSDPFTLCLNATLERQKSSYTPVQVDVSTLERIKRSDVFVCLPSSKSKRATFYRNMLPEIPIAISQPCHRFFHLEDFEFAYLSEQKCPYSRLKSIGEYGSL